MTRCVWLTFFGEYRGHHHPHESPKAITGPLVVLAGFSIVAGLGAMLLAGRLPETTIVVSVIVIGTMLSWFHLDDSTPSPRAATVRYPRKHRR